LRRARFQRGWLVQKIRKTGAVWLYNFREYTPSGTVQRCITVGPVSKYPTEAEANRAVELKRFDINQEVTQQTPGPLLTIELLAGHYREHELADLEDEGEGKASSTKDAYESYLANWIVPQWGSYRLNEVRTIAVENWLKGLRKTKGRAMAKGTKAKIRNIMHGLYEHAIRYEFTDRNPITQVRQSSKRERLPEILDVKELQALFSALGHRERAMVLTDAGSGLRRSELFALKWSDIDFDRKQANVSRSIIHNTRRNRIGICKTEASRKPVPLDDLMIEELCLWRQQTEYRAPENWVWASPAVAGQFPYWPQTIMIRFIRPAAKTAGIGKRIGWHTFRHSFSSLLKANGEDIKVVQELLRHANSKITLDTYTQALSPSKREAQSKVVRMIWEKKTVPEQRGGEVLLDNAGQPLPD